MVALRDARMILLLIADTSCQINKKCDKPAKKRGLLWFA